MNCIANCIETPLMVTELSESDKETLHMKIVSKFRVVNKTEYIIQYIIISLSPKL